MKPSVLAAALLLAACGSSNNSNPDAGPTGAGWSETTVLPPGPFESGTIWILVLGDDIYVSTDTGVVVSSDDGVSWREKSNGLGGSRVETLAAVGDSMFAGADDGVYKSADRGANWAKASSGLPSDVGPYAFWVDGTTVLLGMNFSSSEPGREGAVFRTLDNGASWVTSSTGLPQDAVNSFTAIGGTLFASYAEGVARSTDHGQNWLLTPKPEMSNVLWLEHVDSTLFIATANKGVFKSSDMGQSFVAARQGLPAGEIISTVFATGGKLFAGTDDKGVFSSSDGAANWSALNDGFGIPLPRVIQFAVHGRYLFAVTEGLGVWRREL